ncbi:hypothetical protein BDB01DRAFT_789806 [Pilobolus umbonatus]|nr:hypothetical protein BDB01DRAFT_789806 [Pilobolus umbonatus]
MASKQPHIELKHGNKQQAETMDELSRMFHIDKSTVNNVIDLFRQDLESGLVDDRSSDLDMIPSYVTGYPDGNEKGTYLAIEIAGMDIYACQVHLKGDGGKLDINQYQYKIPHDLGSSEDFALLIDYITECISDFLMRMDTQENHIYPMAVSFGFAIKQTGLDRGYLLSLGYSFNYPNGVGVDIMDTLHERIHQKGLPVKIVAIANDSVCTLLANAYQHPTTRLGIVHGLGTNCAYYESTKNVTKLKDQVKEGDMIINTEWANFGSSRKTLPRTWFDRKLARESTHPQFHLFEKMTTGIFLGELVRNVLMYLIDQDIIFEGRSSDTLDTAYSFDTSYMYICEADDSESLEDIGIVLEDMLNIPRTKVSDREIVKKICQLIGERAATLMGAAIVGVIQHMVFKGIGMTEEGYSISISGNTYEDYPSFHLRVCKTIRDFLPKDIASKLSVGIVKHSRIVGAAIVAMMAEKMNQSTITA